MPDSPHLPDREAAPRTHPDAHEGFTRSALLETRWSALVLTAVAVLLLLSSALVGALLALRLQPSPASLRIAVVDTPKIAEAVADASQHDAGLVQRWPAHFDEFIRQMQDAEPNRLLLVREAVIGTGWEDVTPLLLQELQKQPGPALPLIPTPKGSAEGRSHVP